MVNPAVGGGVIGMVMIGLLAAAVAFFAGTQWQKTQLVDEGALPLRRRRRRRTNASDGSATSASEVEPESDGVRAPQYDPSGAGCTAMRPGDVECAVCMHHRVDCLLKPCHHIVTCQCCAGRLDGCPYCRAPIDARERVFL
jgi:hypothetical protein